LEDIDKNLVKDSAISFPGTLLRQEPT